MTERAIDGIFNEDCITGVGHLADGSVDLVIADPPYGLGKDYGNDSDKLSGDAYLAWSERWIDAVRPKLARNGSLYLFCTWQYAPELFVMLKQRLTMVNEIIWDRRVPSMGGSTRKFSSVHDNIGFFAASMVQAISGFTQKSLNFFLGISLEPAQAGIKSNTFND